MTDDWNLAGLLARPQAPNAQPRAAVLACLYPDGGKPRIVFIKRPSHMPTHAGDLAFPGGKPQPGETPLETALREAHEEVGIEPDTVEVLGYLPDIHTVKYERMVVPVVGMLHQVPLLRPDPGEVEKVLTPALDLFRNPHRWRTEDWADRQVHFFDDVDGEVLWGATARMVRRLVGLGGY